MVSVGGSNAIKSGQTLLNGRSGCFFKAINGRRTIFVVMVVVSYLADILNLSRAILLTSRNQSIDQAVKIRKLRSHHGDLLTCTGNFSEI